MNSIQILMLGVIGAIVVIGSIISWNVIVKEKRQCTESMITQGCVITTVGSLFNVAAMCSPVVSAKPTILIYILWGINIVLLFCCYYIKRERFKKKIRIIRISTLWGEYKYIFLVLLFSTIARIVLFKDLSIERWDAGEYYYSLANACENYQFTLGSVWWNFRLCNHSTLGFSLLMGIGEFLNPKGVQGVLYVCLILTILALGCVYVMLRNYWAKFSDGQAAIGVLLISVAPLMLGTCGYFNVDYVLALAFIFMVYCEYKKKYLLLLFWSIILVQTKETGVFVFAGYYLAHFVKLFLGSKGKIQEKVKRVFYNEITWVAMGVVATYAAYILKLGSFTAWSQTSGGSNAVLWSNSGMNCFGFNIRYIIIKGLQFSSLNFAWLMILIPAVIIIYALRKKKKIDVSVKNIESLIGGICAFAAFSFLYITYQIERYNVIFVILFILVLYQWGEKLLQQINLGKVKKTILWMSVASLFFIQTFYPIDFVSNFVFRLVDTGTSKMLFTGRDSNYFGDYLVNNYQYTWLDNALNKLFERIDYNEDVTIILSGEQVLGTHVNGNGQAYTVYWDTVKKKRVMYKNDNTCNIITCGSHELEEKLHEIGETAVAIFVPYYEINEDEYISMYQEWFEIQERESVETGGGAISYYRMKKK